MKEASPESEILHQCLAFLQATKDLYHCGVSRSNKAVVGLNSGAAVVSELPALLIFVLRTENLSVYEGVEGKLLEAIISKGLGFEPRRVQVVCCLTTDAPGELSQRFETALKGTPAQLVMVLGESLWPEVSKLWCKLHGLAEPGALKDSTRLSTKHNHLLLSHGLAEILGSKQIKQEFWKDCQYALGLLAEQGK